MTDTDRPMPAPWSPDARRYGFDWDAYFTDDTDDDEQDDDAPTS